MRRWHTVLAIGIATLWVAVGSHCLLESLAGLEFFSCEQHAGADTSPAHSEDDCGADGCWAIESGSYQAQRPLNAPVRPVLALAAWLSVLPALSLEGGAGQVEAVACAPPELTRLWQFSQRSALPPRAPTFIC